MKTLVALLVTLLSICSHAQIANGGFEDWDTTYANAYSDILSGTFGIPDPVGGVIDHWVSSSGYGVSQTTDSYAGDYSLILHNWYSYAREWINYDDAIKYRPVSIDGYYKYDVANPDHTVQGYLSASLTRFNGMTTDTIARADGLFAPVEGFTPFSFTFNYTSALEPDSLHIYVINADRICDTSAVCNFLYLDDLKVSEMSSSVEKSQNVDQGVSVYPNPVTDHFTIESKGVLPLKFTLYNSLGIELISINITNRSQGLNFSAYPADVYYYTVTNADGEAVGKIVKQ